MLLYNIMAKYDNREALKTKINCLAQLNKEMKQRIVDFDKKNNFATPFIIFKKWAIKSPPNDYLTVELNRTCKKACFSL
jgi:Trp operon repressor